MIHSFDWVHHYYMKYYNFKKRDLFSGPHLLGVLFIVAGVFAMTSPYFLDIGVSSTKATWVGIGATTLGIMVVSTFKGTWIDFEQNRVKEYTAFLGFKFGKWVDLPKFSRVRLYSKIRKTTNTPNGISPTLSGNIEEFIVLLVGENSETKFDFVFLKKKRACHDANIIAKNLGMNLDTCRSLTERALIVL